MSLLLNPRKAEFFVLHTVLDSEDNKLCSISSHFHISYLLLTLKLNEISYDKCFIFFLYKSVPDL